MISYNAAISACEKASEWQASLATLFELLGWVKFLLIVWPMCVCRDEVGVRENYVASMFLVPDVDLVDQFCP